MRLVGDSERGHQVAGRRLHVQRAPRLRGDDTDDVARADRERRVLRGVPDPLLEIGEETVGPRPGESELRVAVARQLEHAGDLPDAEMPAARPVRDVHGSRQRRLGLYLRPHEIARRQLRAVDLERNRDRFAGESRQRLDEDLLCSSPIEQPPVPAGNDLRDRAAQHERRLDAPLVDRAREPAHVGVDDRLVDATSRGDLAPEDANAEALEAAKRPEALALALSRLDRGAPVDVEHDLARLHAPAPPGGGEDDRHVRERA